MTALSTSDDILACAHTLVLAGGYNGFSYADIANVVGIRKASIHHHFPSKADLVRALVMQYREKAKTGIAHMEANVADPVAQVRAYINHWEACIADSSAPFCVCALLAVEMPLLPEAVALEVRQHFDLLSTWLASTFKRGLKQERLHFTGTPKAEALVFMATVHGAMLAARAYGDASVFRTITAPLLKRLVVTH